MELEVSSCDVPYLTLQTGSSQSPEQFSLPSNSRCVVAATDIILYITYNNQYAIKQFKQHKCLNLRFLKYETVKIVVTQSFGRKITTTADIPLQSSL